MKHFIRSLAVPLLAALLIASNPSARASVLFDGTNDQLRGTLTSNYGEPLTIAVKIKIADHPATAQSMINIGNANNTQSDSYRCRVTATDNSQAVVSEDSAAAESSAIASGFVDDTWVSVICTINNDDGTQAGNARTVRTEGTSGNNDLTRTVVGTLTHIAIGEALNDAEDFAGRIAEVAIWDVDLSSGDEDDYVANECTANIDPTNLIAYWPLVDDADDLANDGLDSGGDLTASGNAAIDADHPTMGSCGGDPPAFSAGPTESPITNGHQIGGTVDANATVYSVKCNEGDADPNFTELVAGQCGGGNTAMLSGSEAWTAGVGNTFDITASNKPPRGDVFIGARNGDGDSSITKLSAQDRSARSGFAILALTSLSASSIFDCATCVNGGSADAYFDPDVAVGDVIEYEDDTNEEADCNVTFEADGDFELEPVGAGDCDGSRSFNISYQDTSSATNGLFNVGTFATDDSVTTGNAAPQNTGGPLNILLTVGEAMTPYDLDARWTDEEGGTVTITFPTTLPTGLSVTLGNLGGTPTACGVFTETERGTDPAGTFTEVTATISIGPRNVDLTGMDESEVAAAIAALCP